MKKSILITLSLAVVALGIPFFTNGVNLQQNDHTQITVTSRGSSGG